MATVKLQKEVEFTQNYIDLMQQRLSSKVKLNVEKGGLGIVNIKKRLDLLYGEKAKFNQRSENNTYIIDLILPTGQNT